MTISALPTPPSRSNSAAFAAQGDAFLASLPTFATEANALADQLNSIGVGTYSATSTTPLTIATGSKTLTIETGKSFVTGQAISIALTASPSNYMAGQVTSYNAGTGALVVNVTAVGGSGTSVQPWSVSITSIVAGGGVSPDSIVALTSGTSWTCPAGVTKVRYRMVGGGGGAGYYDTSNVAGSGAAAGYCEGFSPVVPGAGYTYSIGAGGAAATSSGSGVTGGNTSMFGATASGGPGGTGNGNPVVGGSATGGAINVKGEPGIGGANGAPEVLMHGGNTPFGAGGIHTSPSANGYGAGGCGKVGTGGAGSPGAIYLELYK